MRLLNALAKGIIDKRLMIGLLLASIMIVAFYLRIMPISYGIYLYEYDPYFQYYLTKYLVENGPFSWFQLTKENVRNFWYPIGRDVYKTEYPGVAYIGYVTYMLIRSLFYWVPQDQLLLFTCVILPPIMGVLEVLGVFLICRELLDDRAGLIAALVQAFLPAALDRTIAGFYTKLGFGVTIFLFAAYFLLKMSKSGRIGYAVITGILLGLVAATWGGVTYVAGIVGLFGIVTALLGLNDKRFTKNFVILTLLFLMIASAVPKLGVFYPVSFEGAILLVSCMILLTDYALTLINIKVMNRIFIIILTVIGGISILSIAWWMGVLRIPPIRQLSIVAPWLREINVVFSTVAEHRPMSWDIMMMEFGLITPLMVAGIPLLVLERTREKLFIVLGALTSVYGVSSVAYLIHLAAPFVAICVAVALSSLIDLSIKNLVLPAKAAKRRRVLRIDPALILALFTIIILLLGVSSAMAYSQASTIVPTIANSGIGGLRFKITSWIDALNYMKTNLPEDAVVVSWWDYGYWITVGSNKTSVCDNATLNTTQITLVARAMVSSEDVAVDIIFNKLKTPPNSTYILVYEPFYVETRGGYRVAYLLGGGLSADLGKASAMIRIAGYNFTNYYNEQGLLDWNSESVRNGTLFKLIINGLESLGYTPVQGGNIVEVERLVHFELERAFVGVGPDGATTVIVFLYKVIPP